MQDSQTQTQRAQPVVDPGHGNGAAPDSSHAPAGAEHEIPTDLPKPRGFIILVAIGAFVLFLGGLFVLGLLPHLGRVKEAEDDARQQSDAQPIVSVAAPKIAQPLKELHIPCDIRPFADTSIFPQTTGYLKKWNVDIQDHVTADQIIAIIDTPQVDAELAQSLAALDQAKANVNKANADLDLAKKTLVMYQESSKSNPGSVAELDLETKQSAAQDAQAALDLAVADEKAGDATVKQYQVLQGFEIVKSPFAGTVTARNYDNGALVSPTEALPMFRIEQTDTLRVFASVPQTYATSIREGQDAYLTLRNYPGRKFTGKVARSAGALNASTRTLSYELDFPNADGAIYAGMYGDATIPVEEQQATMTIPTSALIFNSSGLRAAVVEDGVVHLKILEVGRDFGNEIEVTSGLDKDDQVVTNPGLRLGEGVEVTIAQAAAPPAAPAPAAAAADASPSRGANN
jgi:membrane fusion protein (multidrug efflux system)